MHFSMIALFAALAGAAMARPVPSPSTACSALGKFRAFSCLMLELKHFPVDAELFGLDQGVVAATCQ